MPRPAWDTRHVVRISDDQRRRLVVELRGEVNILLRPILFLTETRKGKTIVSCLNAREGELKMDNHDDFHFTMRLCVGSKGMQLKFRIRRLVIRAVLYVLDHWTRNN